MPAAAAEDIGRPVPAKLEIEVVKKFMKYDTQYANETKKQFPGLVKPAPEVGASGTGGVLWVGLNQDPCKAKYLAKCGISRTANPAPSGDSKPAEGEPAKKEFSLAGFLSTAPLPYPHWQGELHGPFERPKTEGVLSRVQSSPASLRDDARSRCSKRTSMHSSVVTRASVAKAVSEEVQRQVTRQLDKMSCQEHYLEQTLHIQGVPSCVKPAKTPADLNELIYYGTTQQEEGKGKFVGKMMARCRPPPDTICIT